MSQQGSHDNPSDKELANRISNMCVLQTIESMASHATGVSVRLGFEQEAERQAQKNKNDLLMERRVEAYIHGKVDWSKEHILKKIGSAIRLDQIQVKQVVEGLKNRSDDLGKVFQRVETVYAPGDGDMVLGFLQQGYQVGLFIVVPESETKVNSHVFHIGINEKGQPVDLSDTGKTQESIQHLMQSGYLETALQVTRELTNSWCIVAMREKE